MVSNQCRFGQGFKNVLKKEYFKRSPNIHRVGVSTLFFISLPIAAFGIVISINTAKAQEVSSDGTLSTTVTKSADNLNFTINNGNKVGGNLFHSFKEFSVPNNGSAVFQNDLDVRNIIGRVTGGLRSDINGLIKAQGRANLFLLNPAGIFFGQNARLDIGGSFFGTTANSLLFDGGVEFSATDLQPPLLTVNIPNGLKFRDNPANITNQSVVQDNTGFPVGLQVNPGNSLALVGGDVSLAEGGRLTAASGRIELGGLAKTGTVGLDITGNTFKLNFPANSLSNVSLANDARAAVRGNGGGDIAVNANIFTATNGGQLVGGVEGPGDGGDIIVNSNEFNISGVGAQNGSGSGSGSGISQQVTSGNKLSNAGNITVNTQSFNASSNAEVQSRILPQTTGNAGDITINARTIFLTDGAFINAATSGIGNAGNVTINATDRVSFDGAGSDGFASGVFSSVGSGAVGNGGSLNFKAGSLTLTNGAQISAGTLGEGDAGKVNIDVRDRVSFDGAGKDVFSSSGVFSYVGTQGQGDGGNVTFNAGSLTLTNGAQISSSTFGQGNAGDVTINVFDQVAFDGVGSNGFASGVFSSVETEGLANGGNVTFNAGSLTLTNGAKISASTRGIGNAGDVNINAINLTFDGVGSNGFASGVFSNVEAGGEGNGGDININARSLSLTNGGQLNTFVRGASATLPGGRGNAGNVTINAINLTFDGVGSNGLASGAFSSVEPGAVGNGGNLRIFARRFDVNNGAQATVSNLGVGNAGNLEVRASDIGLFNQGKLTAESVLGKGGNINLQADNLLRLRRNSLVSAISGTPGSAGQDGNITINTTFLVAPPSENSDIVATGFDRSVGSNVQVNAQGVFGIKFREKLTPESDIVATGIVTLITLETDPSRGLVELPETVQDSRQQVAQNPCQQGGKNEFVVTGRGGLPPSPNQTLNSDNTRVDLVEPVAMRSGGTKKNTSVSSATKPIVPAQGWVLNDKGEVVLTAYNPTSRESQRSWGTSAACPAR
jgi:filamentous hemagglutinin family protein